jgi:hypothetical protein
MCYSVFIESYDRCPVCKAAVTKDTVIPLYARGGDGGHGMHARARAGAPQRPPGRRPATPPPVCVASYHISSNFLSFMTSRYDAFMICMP